MKIRLGFVSNSSSASFTLFKGDLTEGQLYGIRNCVDLAEAMKLDYREYLEEWTVTENDTHIMCDTVMDNFDITELFDAIEIPVAVVQRDSEE